MCKYYKRKEDCFWSAHLRMHGPVIFYIVLMRIELHFDTY